MPLVHLHGTVFDNFTHKGTHRDVATLEIIIIVCGSQDKLKLLS
jgi:hypothetical protein